MAVNLLSSFSLPIMVPTKEYLFSDRSSVSNSLDSTMMIAAKMLLPLYPCKPRNFNLDNPS